MRHYRVLIVDDETSALMALYELLKAAGHDVVGAETSGEAALMASVALRPDLIIMDAHMSGIGGMETAKRITETAPAPIIMCTEHYDDHTIAWAPESGIYGCVAKPVLLSELLPAIEVAISRFGEADGGQDLAPGMCEDLAA